MCRGLLIWNMMNEYYMMWLFLCIDSFVLYMDFYIYFILYFEFFVGFKQWTPL
jgi:hypothetical protein